MRVPPVGDAAPRSRAARLLAYQAEAAALRAGLAACADAQERALRVALLEQVERQAVRLRGGATAAAAPL